MTKADFITLSLLLLGLTFIFLGVYHKLEQRKEQTVCMGHLHQLGTATNLCSMEFRSRLDSMSLEDWQKSIRNYLYDPKVMNCPKKQQGGYVMHFHHLKRHVFPNKESKPIVFDGEKDAYEYRHLGGANTLLSNGVAIFKSRQGKVYGKYQLKLSQSDNHR